MNSRKVCRDCDLERPISEFHRNAKMADGHLNFCRDCVNKKVVWKYRDRPKTSTEKRTQEATRYREKYPHKRKAHQAVYRAIQSGKLVRLPCDVCGDQRSHAHHEDYSMPLVVVWLCKKHHVEAHKMSCVI